MTKDEAIAHAQAFVRAKYATVPPVESVHRSVVRQLGARLRLRVEGWTRIDGSKEMRHSVGLLDLEDPISKDTAEFAGKWIVYFFMSWDTDAARMPQTLYVAVDDLDASVTQISPE